jgi:hypothetical protein
MLCRISDNAIRDQCPKGSIGALVVVVIVIAEILCGCLGTALAQTPLTAALSDSITGSSPLLRFGMDKIANTFLFRGDVSGVFSLSVPASVPLLIPLPSQNTLGATTKTVAHAVSLGTLLLQSRYNGSTIRLVSPASRDDADIVLRYTLPLDSPDDCRFALLALHTASISSDSRAIGLNRFQQFTGSLGAEVRALKSGWQPFETVSMRLVAGGEYNEQLGIIDRGLTIIGALQGQNLRLDDYEFTLDANGFASALFTTNTANSAATVASPSRMNNQWNARVNVNRTFEGNSQLDFTAQYLTLQRDFYTTLQTPSSSSLTAFSTESRLERLLRISTHFVLPIAGVIDADVQGFVENWAIGREYRAALEGAPITAVRRDVDQLRFSVSTALRANVSEFITGLGTSSYALGLTIDSREEANTIRDRFALPDADIQTLRLAERQRDNVSLRTTLFLQTAWNLAPTDTIRAEYATSLLRYDTPSTLNNDDRDELTMNASGSYTHVFSQVIRGTVLADVRLAHVVFIKAQRSAQNNWNRVLRLVPSFVVQSGALTMRPQFEILANYTSFDFEDLLGSAQSFSLRQIAYRDSLQISLSANATIESRVIVRYFERGEFRWQAFSETPRDRNIEAFVRMLCVVMPQGFAFGQVGNARIGAGARLYILSQEPSGLSVGRVPSFLNRSLAPETLIELDFRSGSSLRINAWYEFQSNATALQRSIPNVLLSVNVRL